MTTRVLPERLKKRLLGELVLFFDREFPLTLSRINEIDEKLSKIVSNTIFLMENVMELPSHIQEPVLNIITGGNRELEEKLMRLYKEGSDHYWEWLDAASKLAERKIEKISDLFERENK